MLKNDSGYVQDPLESKHDPLGPPFQSLLTKDLTKNFQDP